MVNKVNNDSKNSDSQPNFNKLTTQYDKNANISFENANQLEVYNDNKKLQENEYNSLLAQATSTPQNNDSHNVINAQAYQQSTPSFYSPQIYDNLYAKRIQKQQQFNQEVDNLQAQLDKQQSFQDDINTINTVKKQDLSNIEHNTLDTFKQDNNSQNYFSAMFLNADKSFKQDAVEIGFQQQMQQLSKDQTEISDLYNEVVDFYDKQQIQVENKQQSQQQQNNQQQKVNQNQNQNLLDNYPFYSTVYQICGKCKQKHLNHNQKTQKEEKEIIQDKQIFDKQSEQTNQSIQNEQIPQVQIIKPQGIPKNTFTPPQINKQLSSIENKVPITIQTIQYQKPQREQVYIQETVFSGFQFQDPQIDEQILVGRGQQQKVQTQKQNSVQYQQEQYKQVEQQIQQYQPQQQQQTNQQQTNDNQVNQIIKVLFNGEVKPQKQQEQQQESTPADEIIKQIIKQSISSQGSLSDSEFTGKCASVLQKSSQQTQQSTGSDQIQQQTAQPEQQSNNNQQISSQSIKSPQIKSSQLSQQNNKSQQNITQTTISDGQVYPQVDSKILNNNSMQLSMSAGQIPSQIDKNIEYIKKSDNHSLGEIN